MKHVWGDDVSGQTTDWIYISTEEVSQIVFGMPVGGRFGQSDDFKDVYDSDILWRVLQGTLVVLNPETGEVHRAKTGESLYFHGDIWHHGYSYGDVPLRVMEFSAPSAIQAVRYAIKKPPLTDPKFSQDEFVGRWPDAMAEARDQSSVRLMTQDDILWRFEGDRKHILVGHVISTTFLTAGEIHLLPGQLSDLLVSSAIKTMYVLEGTLNVQLPDEESWIEAHADDGVYLPAGTPHRLLNFTTKYVRVLFQLVPPSGTS